LLGAPVAARTAHFVLQRPAEPVVPDLPTDDAPREPASVDNSIAGLGLVVPKRHARRAVTRNLIKRQMREAVVRHGAALGPRAVLLRLRTGFERAQFPSAASDALRLAVRVELDDLMRRAAR
jgi:ribonuclease P protein component